MDEALKIKQARERRVVQIVLGIPFGLILLYGLSLFTLGFYLKARNAFFPTYTLDYFCLDMPDLGEIGRLEVYPNGVCTRYRALPESARYHWQLKLFQRDEYEILVRVPLLSVNPQDPHLYGFAEHTVEISEAMYRAKDIPPEVQPWIAQVAQEGVRYLPTVPLQDVQLQGTRSGLWDDARALKLAGHPLGAQSLLFHGPLPVSEIPAELHPSHWKQAP